MRLYRARGACSLAVHIALLEIGVEFESMAVDLARHTTADGRNYYDISPRGYVPLLELDDGSRLTEVGALLQYVAELDPSQTLIGGPGSAHRRAVIEWLFYVCAELHHTFSPWLWRKETADSTIKAVKEKLVVRFEEMDLHLAQREYLAPAYSVADAYAFTIVNWASFVALTLAPYPNLRDYLARVAARPAVQAAMRAENSSR